MHHSNSELPYLLALLKLPKIGPSTAKTLIGHYKDASKLFQKEHLDELETLKNTPKSLFDSSERAKALEWAYKEVDFIEKHQLRVHYLGESSYPYRLSHCPDAPLLLFQKGNTVLNPQKSVAVVGTRDATSYGKNYTEQLVKKLKPHECQIVSGLAYGIDAAAHRAALKSELPTLAVLAHSLDRVYPFLHHKLAEEIVEHGGSLISDYPSHKSKPDRENFPKRNRIIAGMSDLTVVVEAASSGGALITAELANQYNRDVFALPGRIDDPFSKGCNTLIKSHKAHLLQSHKDIEYIMRWKKTEQKMVQGSLFVNLDSREKKIMEEIKRNKNQIALELLCIKTELKASEALAALMSLELKGLVEALPGKNFRLF